MTTLLHSLMGALLGWLVWRLAPRKLSGIPSKGKKLLPRDP